MVGATVLSCCVGLPLTAGAAGAATPVRLTVTRLPDLGYGGAALAFTSTTIVGSVIAADGSDHAAEWIDGRLRVLDVATPSDAEDINAGGSIVLEADDFSSASVLAHGRVSDLQNVTGSSGPYSIYARRINARGQIAGTVDGLNLAARWNSATAAPTVLPPAAGYPYSFSKGINDEGDVAGDSDEADYTPHASVWDLAGHVRVFSGIFGKGSPGDIFEINNGGESAGESYEPGDNGPSADEATVWSRTGRPTAVGFLPGDNQSTALGLSDYGTVAGESSKVDYSTGAQLGNSRAFVWLGLGPVIQLPVPGVAPSALSSIAHQISGLTVVGAAGTAAVMHPYVWRLNP